MLHCAPFFTNIRLEDLPTKAANRLFLFNSCNVFSRSVKGRDLQSGIYGEDSIGNAVQYDAGLVLDAFAHGMVHNKNQLSFERQVLNRMAEVRRRQMGTFALPDIAYMQNLVPPQEMSNAFLFSPF